MAVLIAQHKRAEAATLFKGFMDFPPTPGIDTESLELAKQLMAG
jgi:hypothetical protein